MIKKQGQSYDIAIDLPASIKSELARIFCGLPEVTWCDEQNLNLRLRNLGVIEGGKALDIADSLNTIKMAPFELSLSGIGHSMQGRGNGFLWAGVSKSSELDNLKKNIDSSLIEFHFHKEKKDLIPCIILGHFNRMNAVKLIAFLEAYSNFQSKSFIIDAFSLFSSHATDKRIIYVKEGHFNLKKNEKNLKPTV